MDEGWNVLTVPQPAHSAHAARPDGFGEAAPHSSPRQSDAAEGSSSEPVVRRLGTDDSTPLPAGLINIPNPTLSTRMDEAVTADSFLGPLEPVEPPSRTMAAIKPDAGTRIALADENIDGRPKVQLKVLEAHEMGSPGEEDMAQQRSPQAFPRQLFASQNRTQLRDADDAPRMRQGYFVIPDVKKPADRVELKHAAYAKDETDWRDWQPSDRGPVVKADGRVELMPINSRASEKEREEAEWTSSKGSGGGGSSDFSPAPRSLAPDPASREAWRSGPRTLKGVQYNSAGGGMPIVGRVGLSLVGEDERRRENARNAAVRDMQRAELAGASNLDFRARQASIEDEYLSLAAKFVTKHTSFAKANAGMMSTRRSERAQKSSPKKTVSHKVVAARAGGQTGGGVVSPKDGIVSPGSGTVYDLPVAPQSVVSTRMETQGVQQQSVVRNYWNSSPSTSPPTSSRFDTARTDSSRVDVTHHPRIYSPRKQLPPFISPSSPPFSPGGGGGPGRAPLGPPSAAPGVPVGNQPAPIVQAHRPTSPVASASPSGMPPGFVPQGVMSSIVAARGSIASPAAPQIWPGLPQPQAQPPWPGSPQPQAQPPWPGSPQPQAQPPTWHGYEAPRSVSPAGRAGSPPAPRLVGTPPPQVDKAPTFVPGASIHYQKPPAFGRQKVVEEEEAKQKRLREMQQKYVEEQNKQKWLQQIHLQRQQQLQLQHERVNNGAASSPIESSVARSLETSTHYPTSPTFATSSPRPPGRNQTLRQGPEAMMTPRGSVLNFALLEKALNQVKWIDGVMLLADPEQHSGPLADVAALVYPKVNVRFPELLSIDVTGASHMEGCVSRSVRDACKEDAFRRFVEKRMVKAWSTVGAEARLSRVLVCGDCIPAQITKREREALIQRYMEALDRAPRVGYEVMHT